MKKYGCWLSLMLVVALLASCSTVQRSGPALIPHDELHQAPPPQAKALWDQAAKQQKEGNVKAAISSWEQIAHSYPNNAIAAESFYKLGDAYLQLGQADRALQYFDYLVYAYPQWDNADLAKIGQLRALWSKGERKRVEREAGALVESSPQNPEARVQLAELMINISKDKRDYEKGFNWAQQGFNAATTDRQKKLLTEATAGLLKQADEATINRLMQTNPDAFMRLFLEFRMAQIRFEKEPTDSNRQVLSSLLQQNPGHPLALEIQASLRGAPSEVTLPLHTDRIGCLIPLNGPYRKYGSSVLRGITLAEEDWNQSHPDQQITVIVRDTQAEPELTKKSFEDLAKNEGVLAIIGPLGAKSAKTVFPFADKWNMPLLTLSQKDEETASNPYVLHVFLDNRDMVETLVNFCREKMGYTKFATLYPNDRYGQRLSKIFSEVVLEQGGSLLASVAYQPNSTDFKEPIQKLKDTAKRNSPPSGLNVTPFEVLFIPDQVQEVVLVAPQLPYYNVVGTTLLGTNLWGEAPLAQEGGAYVENAIFATSFSADGQSRETQGFRQKYESIYHSPPNYLEAQAYDALMLLLQARYTLPPSSIERTALLQSLLGIRDYSGVTGTCSVMPDGKLQKEYFLLQIKDGRTMQVYP